MTVVKFSKPHNYEGKEYAEIELDLDALTGNDIEQAQQLLVVEKKAVPGLPEFSKAYCAQVAALAAKQPVELIRSLRLKDYNQVIGEVQDFLLDGAL
jgi:hypothetical protein